MLGLSRRHLGIALIVAFELLTLSYFVLHAPAIDETSRQQEALRRSSSQNIRQCLSPRQRDPRFVDPRVGCVTPRQRHEALRDLVYEAKTILETLHVVYWLDSGTLLGQNRMNDLLPWDLSAEIGILREGFEVLNVTEVVVGDGYELNVPNSKIHSAHDRSEELPVRLVETKFGFYVDVFVFHDVQDPSQPQPMLGSPPSAHWSRCVKCASVNGSPTPTSKHFVVPRDWILPTQRCFVHKFEVMCPAQAKLYLEYLYGDEFMVPSVWS